jgi:hypothetical protein
MTGEPSDDDAALAYRFVIGATAIAWKCNRRIKALMRRGHVSTKRYRKHNSARKPNIRCLFEQRGEDDPAVSWQGCEDRRVALLIKLSRTGLPLARRAHKMSRC